MVFSSVPVFQVLDPPYSQHQPPGGSVSDTNNDDRIHHHLTLPHMPPSYGLSIEHNSMAERPRLTNLIPQQETAYKCPRCASMNTKFCYYNNYSLSQPRHFCKACRRYWTRGGALRNVPVGGGFRRNKKTKRIIRSKSPITGTISSTSGVSSSSCTTNNILGHSAPSIFLPHFPLFPSINFTCDPGVEDFNSLYSRGIHYPTTTTGEFISDPWRLPVADGLDLPLAGVTFQLRSEGLGEGASQNGFKTLLEPCGPSQIELIKFEEDEGLISLPKNLLGFSGNEHQEYWSSVNAWNDQPNVINPYTAGHLL